ncbi:MAG TPA: CBS domain-containing protein [Polyangia bacterium]
MAIHIVGLHRPATVQLRRPLAFRAAVVEREARAAECARGPLRRDAALVRCHRHASPRHGTDCQTCPRFVGWRDDGDGLHVRCAWTDRDRVRDCMTPAGALIVTTPGARCDDAAALARRHRVRRLLVVNGMRLVGVVSTRELRDGGRVGERMRSEVFAVLADAQLGEALATMVALGIGLLPVIGERFVLGVISRGDLRDIGVARPLFASPRLTLAEAVSLAPAPADAAPAPSDADDSGLVSLDDDTLA